MTPLVSKILTRLKHDSSQSEKKSLIILSVQQQTVAIAEKREVATTQDRTSSVHNSAAG